MYFTSNLGIQENKEIVLNLENGMGTMKNNIFKN